MMSKSLLFVFLQFVIFVSLATAKEIDINNIVALIESTNNTFAVSPVGALGICQIMPDTWKEFALPNEKWNKATDNKKVSARYFKWIKSTLKSNYSVKIKGKKVLLSGDKEYYKSSHLLACYNGGLTKFRKVRFNINKMPLETRNYIKKYEKALASKEQEKLIEAMDMDNIEFARRHKAK